MRLYVLVFKIELKSRKLQSIGHHLLSFECSCYKNPLNTHAVVRQHSLNAFCKLVSIYFKLWDECFLQFWIHLCWLGAFGLMVKRRFEICGLKFLFYLPSEGRQDYIFFTQYKKSHFISPGWYNSNFHILWLKCLLQITTEDAVLQ